VLGEHAPDLKGDKMTRYKIIANPAAGGGAGARAIPKIERLLAELCFDFDVVCTERPWHAAELAKEAALGGCDVVVAAGGDGTANEVLNGLMYDLERACQVLAEDHRRLIDVGRVVGGLNPEGRYFGNCVGVGFDAIGTIEVAKLPRLGGFLSYLIAVLKTVFLYYKAPVSTVVYDDHTLTQPSLMISIMNGRRLGGGFRMAPEAELDDGFFDLCIAHEVSRARIFGLIPHFMRGTQATQAEITTGRAAHISITALEGSLPAQTDGEILCIDGQHLEIELLPRQVEIVCQATGGSE